MGTVVKGLLHAGSITLVYGPPKSGKSFLLTDLFMSVAAVDQEWMGHKIVRPGPILYVACEGHAGFWKRIVAIKIERGCKDIPDEFVLAVGRPQLIAVSEHGRSYVPHPDDVLDALKRMKAERGLMPAAVAIDTVFRSFGAGNVNQSDHMSVYLQSLNAIADQGIALAAVHHEIKSGGTPAGSVALTGGSDTILLVGNGNGNGNAHTWEVEMAKDDASTKPRSFTLYPVDVGPDLDGEPQTSMVVRDAGPADGGVSKRGKKLPKGLAIFKRALDRMLGDLGKQIRPFLDGPAVKAVERSYVRREFMKAYPADNDKAKSKAFERSERDAVSTDLICSREIEKDGCPITFFWPLREP
jgi:hypothetical protein